MLADWMLGGKRSVLTALVEGPRGFAVCGADQVIQSAAQGKPGSAGMDSVQLRLLFSALRPRRLAP